MFLYTAFKLLILPKCLYIFYIMEMVYLGLQFLLEPFFISAGCSPRIRPKYIILELNLELNTENF